MKQESGRTRVRPEKAMSIFCPQTAGNRKSLELAAQHEDRFGELRIVIRRRFRIPGHNHIRDNAHLVHDPAGRCEEMGDGDAQAAAVVERYPGLHRPLAEGTHANDLRTTASLERTKYQ